MNPGDTVRYRIGPSREPISGLVLQVNDVRTLGGHRFVNVNVQWVEHSGQPGKSDWHRADELVVTENSPHA